MAEALRQLEPDSFTHKGKDSRGSGLFVVGASFKTAPIEVREAISRNLLALGESRLAAVSNVRELAVISTCNRVEFYAATGSPGDFFREIASLLPGEGSREKSSHLFRYTGREAVAHLFKVASGLDSVITGEAQILGQVRSAGVAAKRSGAAKGILSPLFDRAFRVGKRTREKFHLDPGEESLSSLAVEEAARLGVPDSEVLLIGTGKMVQLAALKLGGRARRLYIATRRRSLPPNLGRYMMVKRQEIPYAAKKSGVIITATSSRAPILHASDLDGNRRRIIVDLGMPRNVSPSVAKVKGVTLLNLDDLARLTRRRRAAPGAGRALASTRQEANEFYEWLVQTRISTVLAEVHLWANEVRKEEFARASSRLKVESPRDRKVLDSMGRRIVSKLMSRPTAFARRDFKGLNEEEKLEILRSVFGPVGGDGNGSD